MRDKVCGCPITRRQLERDLRLIRADLAMCNGRYPEWRAILEARERELTETLEEKPR